MPLQQEFDDIDSLVDEAHSRRLEIDGEMAKMQEQWKGKPVIPKDVASHATRLNAERKEIDHALQGMVNSPNVPYGYLDHYNQKYMTPKPAAGPAAEPEGPGILSKIFKGAKDTFNYAVQNPGSAFRHITQGAGELMTLPLRAIEGATDTNIPILRPSERLSNLQRINAKRDQAEGIDPRSTGPVVAENIGQMALPLPGVVGPAAKFLSRETAKNVAKGAAVGGGLNIAERTANKETVDDEALTASAGVGGGLAAVLGRVGGKISTTMKGVTKEKEPLPVDGSTPPSGAGRRDTMDPSFVRGATDANRPQMNRRMIETKPTGIKEVLDGTSGPPKTPPSAPDVGSTSAKPLDMLLKKETPAPMAKPQEDFADVKAGIAEEKAARAGVDESWPAKGSASGFGPKDRNAPKEVKQADKIIAPGEKIPPTKLIDLSKKMDEETKAAGAEAMLGKVAKGEVKVKDVPVNRKKDEAPAPAAQGEVGATKPSQVIDFFGEGKPATAKPKAPPAIEPKRNIAPAQAKAPDKNIRLEDHIKEMGYKLEEKEPFPGQKSYNVIDPATGNTIARGDRENILNGLNARNEGKGFKLYSGVDPTPLVDKIREKLRGIPEGVEVTNSPHREKPINMALRSAGLETPKFAMRGSEAGRGITNAAHDFEDLKQTRFNDLFHAPQKDGTYKDTKLFDYFASKGDERAKVNDALVLGDKLGETFTPEQLARQGFTTNQIRMYEGVREGLDSVKGWIKEIGGHEEFDPDIKGYIPRVWSGDLELFVNGTKHVPTKDGRELGSSFSTLREAAGELWKLKQAHPDAKIEARYFSDPNYLMSRGIADARAVSQAKSRIDALGKLSPEEINEAFKVSKGTKDFARHLLERKDARGYETEDLERVLYSYFNQAAKTVEGKKLRSAVETIMKNEGNTLSGAQVKYLNDYVDRVLGKPAWDQMAVNTFVRETPLGKWIDPAKAGAGIKTARDWITYKSLGFGNVSWALVNIDSLTRHVWPMLQKEAGKNADTFATEKYLGSAVKEYFSNKQLRQKLAHNGVIDIQMMSEHRPQIGAHFGKAQITPSQVIMYLGTQTEEFTRGVAAIARYKMALDQGYADSEAMRRASRFVSETVGRYSKAGKPPAFTGLVGSTVGMFKTYPVVMLENMTKALESKDTGVIVRYMLASLGAGGLIGAVPGSEEIDNLATRITGTSPIQWAYKNLGDGITTGLTSIFPAPAATDLSRKAGLPDIFPNQTKDWLGPVWNTYAQAIADTLNGEYGEAVRDLVPTSIRNALSVSQIPGKVVGRYDKPVVDLPPGDGARIMRGLGFQSPEEVRALRDYEHLETLRTSHETELKKLTRRIHDGSASQAERERYAELGGTNRRLREEGRRESLTLRQRQERQLPRLLRHQHPETE